MTNKRLTGLFFHTFPNQSKQRREWLESFRITKKLSSKSYVYISHCTAGDYLPTKPGSREVLSKLAVPSVIPQEPNEEQDSNIPVELETVPCVHEAASGGFSPSILRKSKVRELPVPNLNHNDDDHLHNYGLAENMLEDEFGDDGPDIDFGCDEAVYELENAVADIEVWWCRGHNSTTEG
ncbi:hypothetical protein QAD02_001058 [Eretmocerus hayati]|uniref:Uncharacterized protein n=1 Tax=Eretmocerus hayati TaxID=131215 RepID=A0ACC2NHI7_9HYME|nr:hypothetical protein QAD02_001058 [Eretmocerus hayati]